MIDYYKKQTQKTNLARITQPSSDSTEQIQNILLSVLLGKPKPTYRVTNCNKSLYTPSNSHALGKFCVDRQKTAARTAYRTFLCSKEIVTCILCSDNEICL